MDDCIRIPNGLPLYLAGKLINDFDTIFCQAINNSVYFIGARDHLSIKLKIFNNLGLFPDQNYNWNYAYAFKSEDLKRNIDWFRNKANSNKNERLNILPYEDKLSISNNTVKAELCSYVKKRSPIPRVPEMSGGVSAKISNLKDLVDQIRAINDEIVNLKLVNSELIISGMMHESPIYTIRVTQNFEIEEKSTRCLKPMLLISCQLASELGMAELRFYPGGAIQLSSKGDNMSVRCLLTTIDIVDPARPGNYLR